MTNISKDRQRLIFQGKPLTNNGLLADYGLRDGFTIHLVERPLMKLVMASFPDFLSNSSGINELINRIFR